MLSLAGRSVSARILKLRTWRLAALIGEVAEVWIILSSWVKSTESPSCALAPRCAAVFRTHICPGILRLEMLPRARRSIPARRRTTREPFQLFGALVNLAGEYRPATCGLVAAATRIR